LAYFCLAISLVQQGKLEEAIQNYKKSIEINANFAYAYYNLAVAFKQQGKLEEAIQNYKKPLK
jgi:tetratricopeptide (TPR) repeat protein